MRIAASLLTFATCAATSAAPAAADEWDTFENSTAQHADAYAAATGGNTLQQGRIGGEVEAEAVSKYWYSYAYARTRASAELRGGNDGAGLTVQQEGWARGAFCVFEPTVGEHLTFDAAPSFTDRPDRWRRRYSGVGFDANVVGLNYLYPSFGVQLLRMDDGFSWEIQSDGGVTEHRVVQTADWSPLAILRRRDREEIGRLDPVAMEARGIGGTHSGVVITTWSPRIQGIPLGFGVHLDVAIGHAYTGISEVALGDQPVSTITSVQLPEKDVPATRVRLAVPMGPVHLTATAERGMYLGQDATLVVEERATLAATTRIEGADVRAAGFAAHSVIWTSPTDSSAHVTGGGSVAVDIPLEDRWKLTNQAELARTFYASLDGDRMPRVDTALRLDVGLHHEIPNWIPR